MQTLNLTNPTMQHFLIESAQYSATLPVTGTIIDTSKEKLHQELGFETT